MDDEPRDGESVFDRAYEATPSWEIGRPQGVVIRLADAGRFEGAILDVGCGTGENALELARRGLAVTGVDVAAAAIRRARAKARERGLAADFRVADAMDLSGLGQRFDTVLDVGLFHWLQPEARRRYAASLRGALRPGGHALVVAWSDRNRFGIGPGRIRRSELRAAFATGWVVELIEPETLQTRLPMAAVHAWLARMRAVEQTADSGGRRHR